MSLHSLFPETFTRNIPRLKCEVWFCREVLNAAFVNLERLECKTFLKFRGQWMRRDAFRSSQCLQLCVKLNYLRPRSSQGSASASGWSFRRGTFGILFSNTPPSLSHVIDHYKLVKTNSAAWRDSNICDQWQVFNVKENTAMSSSQVDSAGLQW